MPSVAPCQSAPDAAALEALLAEFLAGASRNDAAVHDRFWADSLVYTRSTGRRVGKADIMKSVREAPPSGPSTPATHYTAEEVRIQQCGDTAVVAFPTAGHHRGRRPGGACGLPEHRHVREARRALAGGRVAVDAGCAAGGRGQGTGRGGRCGAPRRAARRGREVARVDPARELRVDPQHRGPPDRARALRPVRIGEAPLPQARDEPRHGLGPRHDRDRARRLERQRSANPQTPGKGDPEAFPVYYTLTLVNEGAGWKAVAMHTSRP